MIIVLKQGIAEGQRKHLKEWIEEQGISVHESEGEYCSVLGLIGDTGKIDMELLESMDIVESVKRVSDPFKSANRKFHPEDTVIQIGDLKLGKGHFQMIAGPCSVESHEQI